MNSIMKLPLEQRSREETEVQRISWNNGPYNFLLMRTQEKFKHKAAKQSRFELEVELGCKFPEITDEMLKSLYEFACTKYLNKCQGKYGASSGFGKTASERAFAMTLETIIKNNPKLKHFEVYPSQNHSKDLPPNFKMVVGNFVPDFLVFGIKDKKCSAVAIEINGDSHIQKWEKDELRNAHLKDLKIFTWEVPNNQATDIRYITEAITKMYRLRNGSLNMQIQRAKRLIWTKTISCQLSLDEIEDFVHQRLFIQLNLRKEALALLSLDGCPRNIKSELKQVAVKKEPSLASTELLHISR